MQNSRRLVLEEIGKVLGVKKPEEAPEIDSGEKPASHEAPEGVSNPAEKKSKSPLDAFAVRARKALSGIAGSSFPTGNGEAGLEVVQFRPPMIHHREEGPHLVVPVRVIYRGKAAGEDWAKAEKAFEAAVKDTILLNAGIENTGMTNLILRKRRKTDPYEGEESLTILRFGLA